MAQKTPIELLKEIVGAYEALVNEAARGALSDAIYEARDMLKSTPSAEETPFVSSPNKSRDTDRRR